MITYLEIAEYFNIVLCSFACFFATLMLILFYHGVFYKVVVKATKPPFTRDLYVVYKFTLNYSESRNLLAEVQTIAPHLNSFSIYHEAFQHTRSRVGSSVGVVLDSTSGSEPVFDRLVGRMGFRAAIFPAVEYAVTSSFPYRNHFSLALAVNRTYPKIREYIKVHRLCAHPIMELYTRDRVHFVAPLSRQFDFYADEAIPPHDSGSESEEEDATCCPPANHHTAANSSRYATAASRRRKIRSSEPEEEDAPCCPPANHHTAAANSLRAAPRTRRRKM